MKRIIFLIFIIKCSVSIAIAQPPNNLSGLKICIDPGHGGNNAANDRRIEPDPGNVFWESEGNFQKALWLRPMLQARGATVFLTRNHNRNDSVYADHPTNDPYEPSLSARSQFANANNVHWFHSIHSNAGGGFYSMVLIKENIPTRQAAFPQTIPMSGNIYTHIRSHLRTSASSGNTGTAGVYLDYTFYGGTSGGYNLGVLNGLIMPGQLSEGSFHDGFPEARRLLNNNYLKMESYAIMNGFLQYYGCPKDSGGIIAGIQLDANGAKPMNQTVVRLLPENKVYIGDLFNNGFYMFDSLTPGQKIVRFETPNYKMDSVSINVTLQSTTFADRTLYDIIPPKVTFTQPVAGDTNYSVTNIIGIRFSKSMDTASIRSSLSITPNFANTFTWSNSNTQLVIKPTLPLPIKTNFTLTIAAIAKGMNGIQIDGNGDGIAGDQFVLQFKTGSNDITAPLVVSVYPTDANIPISPNQIFNIQFNERLDPSSVTTSTIKIESSTGEAILQTQQVQYWEGNVFSAVNVYTTTALDAGKLYRISIANVKDLSGNAISTAIYKNFSVFSGSSAYTTIDDFNTSVASWLQPTASGSTVGVIVDSAKWLFSSTVRVPHISGNAGAAQLKYGWNTAATSFLLREYLNTGAPRDVKWYPSNTKIQTYILGDESKTRFRFAIDDSVDAFPLGTAANHEVSPWYIIDWIGWRLIEWDFKETGAWLGNRKIEGQLRFDSYQIQYVPDSSAQYGSLYFDQLQLTTQTPTSVRRVSDNIPTQLALQQNYPNPFNPATMIEYSLDRNSEVTVKIFDVLGREVATLVNERQEIGGYSVPFDASRLTSGLYFYTLTAGNRSITKKMLLTK